MTYILSIRSRGIRVECASLSEVSAKYVAARIESNEGGSTFPDGAVFKKGTWGRLTPVGRVSYNGRVWGPEPWQPGAKPIFDAAAT